MLDATFVAPDLSSFTGVDGLGLAAIGQRIEQKRVVIGCRVVADDDWCRRCGCRGRLRDTIVRRLAHAPFGWRPTVLQVKVRPYRCPDCGHVWRQDTASAAEPRAKLTKAALRWALEGLEVHKLTVARVADALDVSWHTANDAVLAEGKRVLIDDPTRFDGVTVIGVDERVWRHTRRGDKYVTLIIDLTRVKERTGPARLLDMIEGRSKAVFKDWLAARPDDWRASIETIAMDGFSGFKTAAAEEIPAATAVMDPFHVVRLAGDALDGCGRRVQQQLHGHRGRAGDPLYAARRTLTTGHDLVTEKQQARLDALFAEPQHVGVEATWGIYQRMIAAYRDRDRPRGRAAMVAVIASISTGVPANWSSCGASAVLSSSEPPTSWPTSTGPTPRTGRPRRSTDASNTSAAARSASATSPTTLPGACLKPAPSGPDYTPKHDEPHWRRQQYLQVLPGIAS